MFKVAGVSTRNGQAKVRFANDMTRIKVLVKTGHTDINLIELPEAMNKPAVVSYLKTTELYANPALREAIDNADAKYNGSGPVVDDDDDKPVKPVKAVKVKPDMDKIKARAAKTKTEVTKPAAEVKKSTEAETV
jgi:hypothetical protein